MTDSREGSRYELVGDSDIGVGHGSLSRGSVVLVTDVVEAGTRGVGLSQNPTVVAAHQYWGTRADKNGTVVNDVVARTIALDEAFFTANFAPTTKSLAPEPPQPEPEPVDEPAGDTSAGTAAIR